MCYIAFINRDKQACSKPVSKNIKVSNNKSTWVQRVHSETYHVTRVLIFHRPAWTKLWLLGIHTKLIYVWIANHPPTQNVYSGVALIPLITWFNQYFNTYDACSDSMYFLKIMVYTVKKKKSWLVIREVHLSNIRVCVLCAGRAMPYQN